MKKLFSAVRLILLAAFIAASVLFTINALRIWESRAIVERVINEEVEYFSDGFLFENGYFSLRNNFDKFIDTDGVEYWVDTKTEQFIYLYNPNTDLTPNTIDEADAKQLIVDEAKKWDAAFFQSDIMIECAGSSSYHITIFELDDKGYKTGRFIRAEVDSDLIKLLEMHTMQNPSQDYMGSVISEQQAIDIAYAATKDTETVLNKEDNHLIRAELNYLTIKVLKTNPDAPDSYDYYWLITLYEIDEQAILSKSQTIDSSAKFVCVVGALDGDIRSFEWLVAETNYCPLTGEILESDADE